MPVKSKFESIPVPENVTFHDAILNYVWMHGTKPAFIDSDTGAKLSFRDVFALSHAVATYLRRKGFGKPAVGAISMRNCAEYGIIFLGTALTGATTTGLNPDYTEYEMFHHLRDSGAQVVFTTKNALPKIAGAIKQLGHQIKEVICIGENLPSEVTPLSQVFATAPDYGFQKPQIDVKTDVVLMPYSSGTTGLPKGVMLTHYNLVNMISVSLGTLMQLISQVKGIDMSNPAPSLGIMPFFHVAGFFGMITALFSGMAHIPMARFHREKFLQLIQDYKMTTLSLVPPLVLFLTKSKLADKYDLSSVRFVGVGAAPLGKELSQQFCEKYPNALLFQAYGMTETSYVSHFPADMQKDQIRHGSIGVVAPNTEAKAVDIDTGKELGPNQEGEVCVRNQMVMKGYRNRDQATTQMIDKEGWLHTGDIGYYDNDGYFFIVDRLKELIKVKGFQVPPAELEDLLHSHEAISDSAVIGIPNAEFGELPKAFVVLHPGHTATPEAIQKFVADRVAPYKRLLGGVQIIPEIPKNPTGKILRRKLREIAKKNAKL